MKSKKLAIIICMLVTASVFPIVTSSLASDGNINDPEITDPGGDAFGYLDIDSVWFHEDENNPEILFVSMKINKPIYWHFQQTFAVFWEYNDIEYFCALHLGFDIGEDWERYSAGRHPHNEYYDDYHRNLSGTYSISEGVITWEIPKEFIGDLEKDDVLTNTWSNAFRRFGLIGRIGFTRVIMDNIILRIFGNSMWDYAPDSGYGGDYIIKY
jgi:hypothetical protein